jgi:hypothetical protein
MCFHTPFALFQNTSSPVRCKRMQQTLCASYVHLFSLPLETERFQFETMAATEEPPKDSIVMQLGKMGLLHVAKINTSASNALRNLEKVNAGFKDYFNPTSFQLRLGFETATRDCAGITYAYKAFCTTERDVLLVLHLSEMVRLSCCCPLAFRFNANRSEGRPA